MKKLFFLLAIGGLAACNNSSDKTSNSAFSGDTLAFGQNSNDTLFFWNVNSEENTRKKVLTQDIVNPNLEAVINGVNMVYPDVQMQLVKQSNDTLFVSIPQSEKLTQQMGSAGASQYFATACINLFEVPGINYINFDFTEGDHARPGTFSREQFSNFKEIN
jgi:hypothetical protein